MVEAPLDLLSLKDDGIAKLYADRVEPILRAAESERQVALRTFAIRLGLCTIGVICLAAAVYLYSHQIEGAFFATLVTGFVSYWFAYRPLQEVATSAKEHSLTAIAGAIGCTYRLGSFEPPALDKFKELHLLPACDRSNYEDCFDGRHRGCAYAFCDGHLEREVRDKNGSHWETVFRGQIIRIAIPQRFSGTTIVRRDAGVFNSLRSWFTNMQRVDLVDSRLEKAFEAYSTDQVEARYLIHPVFMERLLDLETHFKGKNLRCAFVAGDLLIAIEGGDKFEIGSMFAPLNDVQRARSVLADITEVMKVVEAVLSAEEGALPTA